MRVVTLEEHFTVPSLVQRSSAARHRPARLRAQEACRPAASTRWTCRPRSARSGCASMDETGITVQVLSTTGPGADLVDGAEGVALARETNDALAEAIAAIPIASPALRTCRCASPTPPPRSWPARVRELGFRGALINGTTEDRFLDDPRFEPILAAAEAPRRADLYSPPPGARGRAQGLLRQPPLQFRRRAGGGRLGLALGDGIHVLRLVLSGTLDRHPKLKLIIGHMGEGLPMMLARCDQVFEAYIPHLAGRSARPSSTRSGSRPAASSASRRSWPPCRPSASTASCIPSTIPTLPTRAAAPS